MCYFFLRHLLPGKQHSIKKAKSKVKKSPWGTYISIDFLCTWLGSFRMINQHAAGCFIDVPLRDGQFVHFPIGFWLDRSLAQMLSWRHSTRVSLFMAPAKQPNTSWNEVKKTRKLFYIPKGSMGLVYLPSFMVDFYGFHVGKYIPSCMDPMAFRRICFLYPSSTAPGAPWSWKTFYFREYFQVEVVSNPHL